MFFVKSHYSDYPMPTEKYFDNAQEIAKFEVKTGETVSEEAREYTNTIEVVINQAYNDGYRDGKESADVPRNVQADFALTCKGDSMINARIFDGYIVYIHQQDSVDNGQIAAVLIDGEATLKRVHLYEDHISLESANPLYDPIVFWGEEMNRIRIMGKAVAFTGAIGSSTIGEEQQ